jgi:hypothetical protein
MMFPPVDQSLLMPNKTMATIQGGMDFYSKLMQMLAMPEAMKTQQEMAKAQLASVQRQNQMPYSNPGQITADRMGLMNQYGDNSQPVNYFDQLNQKKNQQSYSNIRKYQDDLEYLKNTFGENSPQYKNGLETYNAIIKGMQAQAEARKAYPYASQLKTTKQNISKNLSDLHVTALQQPQAITHLNEIFPLFKNQQSPIPQGLYGNQNMQLTPEQQSALAKASGLPAQQLGISKAPELNITPESSERAKQEGNVYESSIIKDTTPVAVQKARYAGKRAQALDQFIEEDIKNGALDYVGLQGKAKKGYDSMISGITGQTPPKLAAYNRLKAALNTKKGELAQLLNTPADQQARNEIDWLTNIDNLSSNPEAAKIQLNRLQDIVNAEEGVNRESLSDIVSEQKEISKKYAVSALTLSKDKKYDVEVKYENGKEYRRLPGRQWLEMDKT